MPRCHGACTAVGFAGDATGTTGRALAARWTAARGWAIEPAPAPAAARAAFLSGVSCPSARLCTAVGFFTTRAGAAASVAERWTPAGWTTQRIPTPSAATSVQLTGVACASPSLCTAAGWFESGGIQVMLTERWDGFRWVIGRTRYPPGAREVQLTDVACPSPSACTAVGSLLLPTLTVSTSRWPSIGPRTGGRSSPRRRRARHADPMDAGLAGVSCPSPAHCVAVGSATPLDGGGEDPFSLSWGT